jgi:hypothetical protein
MRQTHRAGDKAFVDYSGDGIDVINSRTGEIRPAEIFVGVLGASSYSYAEATWSQELPDWIGSHVRMLNYFQGVPCAIVPDYVFGYIIRNHPGTAGNEGNVMTFGANGDFNHQWFMGMRYPSSSDNIGLATGYSSYINATMPGLAAYDQWRNLSVVSTGTVWNTTVQWDGNNAYMSTGGSDETISVPLGDASGSGGGIGGADGVPAGTILAKCEVAEVLVYDVALSDPARKEIEHNLAMKYGLPWTTTAVVENQGGNAPESFVLMQNYPNPFNPSTTIRFGLPNSSHVTVTVFNTLGQQVGLLQDGEQEAGYHEVRFDGKNFSSGVYFYRIQVRPLDSAIERDSKGGARDFVATKRLLLLK